MDDGSDDGTVAIAQAAGPPIRTIAQEAAGPAAARNRGVAESRGTALAFCDADCFPVPGWLAAGVASLEHAELVQGKVTADPGATLGPFDRSLWIDHEVGLWETANLFVTRQTFDRVGGFEDWLVPVAGKAMAEDVWFGWRAKRAGARSAFCVEALAYHAVFSRGPGEYISERRRCRHFPEMAAKMPELREAFFTKRLFLTARTAAFDAAVVGATLAIARRKAWPLLAAAPFAKLVQDRMRHYGVEVAAVDLAADVVTAWSLVAGSVRAGTPVL